MEQPIVSAVTNDTSEVKLTITGVPTTPESRPRSSAALPSGS